LPAKPASARFAIPFYLVIGCSPRCITMKLTIKDLQQKKFFIEVDPSATVPTPRCPSVFVALTDVVGVDLGSEAKDPRDGET